MNAFYILCLKLLDQSQQISLGLMSSTSYIVYCHRIASFDLLGQDTQTPLMRGRLKRRLLKSALKIGRHRRNRGIIHMYI